MTSSATSPRLSQKKKEEHSPESLKVFAQAIENLRTHAECHGAWHLPSLRSIRVVKQNKSHTLIRINGVTAKLLQAVPGEGSLAWDEAKKLLDAALKRCHGFRTGEELATAESQEPIEDESLELSQQDGSGSQGQ